MNKLIYMEENKTEKIVSEINSNVFFREFTYSKNDFKDLDTKQEHEFADNVVWIDDILFVFQIKDRNSLENENDEKWFDSKILRKAVQQIKSTHKYLKSYPHIEIVNEKGHKKNIIEAKEANISSIVVYTPNNSFPDSKRHQKFYESKDIGLIHLFHSEDYYWICKYLLTPAEIEEYFYFREELYKAHKKVVNKLPEQYVLAHFLETLNVNHIDPSYIENLKIIEKQFLDFDISYLINNFNDKMRFSNDPTEYYPIITEIAKLNRAELVEFKKRFVLILEKCKIDDLLTPYRIYLPRTDCGFVFIPLHKSKAEHWDKALFNYTMAQKYDQKASRCIGVIVYEMIINNETYFDINWNFIESDWVYNSEMEQLLKDNFPFRDVKMKKLDNRYKE